MLQPLDDRELIEISAQDMADWRHFADTLNVFVLSSDKLDSEITKALKEKGE